MVRAARSVCAPTASQPIDNMARRPATNGNGVQLDRAHEPVEVEPHRDERDRPGGYARHDHGQREAPEQHEYDLRGRRAERLAHTDLVRAPRRDDLRHREQADGGDHERTRRTRRTRRRYARRSRTCCSNISSTKRCCGAIPGASRFQSASIVGQCRGHVIATRDTNDREGQGPLQGCRRWRCSAPARSQRLVLDDADDLPRQRRRSHAVHRGDFFGTYTSSPTAGLGRCETELLDQRSIHDDARRSAGAPRRETSRPRSNTRPASSRLIEARPRSRTTRDRGRLASPRPRRPRSARAPRRRCPRTAGGTWP